MKNTDEIGTAIREIKQCISTLIINVKDKRQENKRVESPL